MDMKRLIKMINFESLRNFFSPYFIIQWDMLKAKKTHGFKSCIVISIYELDIPSIRKKKLHNIMIIDKLTP